ncbi:TetR-like C-terminal domain-containing protein [Lactobacillus sp. ESL0785]|uniref:TetR-like C-terminal domain-containing protein n=1 Tax=Lactobacillus sp. ESL0785 TaxID=2983232 RepID=UPI0023F7EC7E|nr:TetR-like C-terminal domain-containing protein [Lactobacillus sp. ESL0785]WEV71005.1 TetR-like C-terminal domain-containing protein [Lactobacillus sp. ESL0785]
MKNAEITLETKRAFSKALKQELQRRSLNKITVKRLLIATNKTRPTFYYHFKDIADLIKWTVQDEIIALLNESKGYSHWDQDLYKILQYFCANRSLGQAFYNCLDIKQFNWVFREPQIKILLGYIDEIIKQENLSVRQDDRKFIAQIFTGGFTEIVLDWLGNGQKESPEKIREELWRTQENVIVHSLRVAAKNKDIFISNKNNC